MWFRSLYFFLTAAVALPQSSIVVPFRVNDAQGLILPTRANGINNAGQVVGQYSQGGKNKAFQREVDGKVQTIEIPGAVDTVATGLNERGDVVGFWDGKSFHRDKNGTLTSLDVASSGSTQPYGINDAGQTTGSHNPGPGETLRGFLRDNGGAVAFFNVVPAGTDPATTDTAGRGVNQNGQVIGQSQTNTRSGVFGLSVTGRSFLREPNGTTSTFWEWANRSDSPWPILANGINGKGFVVGSQSNGEVAFVARPGGTRIGFQIGARKTVANGINDAGQITGYFQDPNGVDTGFILNPCTAPVVPSARNHGSAGELGTLSVQGDTLCIWYAESTVPWITVAETVGNGPSVLSYRLEANAGAQRSGRIRVAGQEVIITQAASSCTYTVSAAVSTIAATGSAGTVNVTTQAGCPWTATSTTPWLTVLSGSGTGTGAVQFNAQSNATVVSRSATISVAGQGVQITQLGLSCSYSLSRTAINSPAVGGTEIVTVTALDGCPWQSSTTVPWITIQIGAQGGGTGIVSLSVAANVGNTPRSGTVSIAGQTVTVTQQDATGCNYVLTAPQGTRVGQAGGLLQISIAAPAACAWTLRSDASWVTVPAGASGTGSGTVTLNVAANTSVALRTATLSAGNGAIVITQNGTSSPAGLHLVSVAPCRLADTRSTSGFTGAFGPPRLPAGGIREFPVPAGRCNIPANAVAYSVNVTVVPGGSLAFLSLWPTGSVRPVVSTLNSFNGRVVANAAIIPAGTNGAISAFVSDATDVIIDINGYFVPPGDPSGMVFYPVTPCRVADTRTAPGLFGSPRVTRGTTRAFPTGSAACGIPAAARAVSLNLTAVPPGPLAFLTVWPAGAPQPLASTLNAFGGQVTANAAIVPAGANGSVNVFASDDTDIIIDVNGFFAPPGAAPGGLLFFPLTPCRLSDTRFGQGVPGLFESAVGGSLTRNFPLANSCQLPNTARAYSLNITAAPAGFLGFLTVGPTGPPLPIVSTLNSWDGQIVANMAIVPAGNDGGVKILVSNPSDVILDLNGYFAP